MSGFYYAYKKLVWDLLGPGAVVETNERTGKQIAMSRTPVHFNVDLCDRNLPVCGIRKVFPRTAAAEVAWYLLGTKDVSFIREYAPIWDKFVEDDGTTIANAYGHRWREHFGRDQIGDAIGTLQSDPTSRQIYIGAWDPAIDGLGRIAKNVPCPVGFTLSIVGNYLNSSIVLRSSDVFVGLPYDVMGHALLMAAIAESIGDGVRLGTMGVTLAHPHLYLIHEEMAMEALGAEHSYESFEMPRWSVEDIEDNPHGYVETVKERSKVMQQPPYSCRPEVVV